MNYNRFSANSPPVIGSIYHYKLSYLAFICLGLGVVLPFHFFIIADPYFHYKLHNSHSVNESISFLELSYENFVILFSSLPNLVTVLLVTFIFVPYIHKYRVYASFFGIAICFVICLLFAFVDVTQWSVAFFILTMVFVVIQSICSAVASNCLFSLTSTLPSRYIQGKYLVYLSRNVSRILLFMKYGPKLLVSLDNSLKKNQVFFLMEYHGG